MSKEKYCPRSPCPIAASLDILGDKWTLLIIRDMIFRGFQEYGEFLAAGEGISTNILAERLKRLQAWGIVHRQENPADRKRVIYTLSRRGIELMPVIIDLVEWGNRHFEHTQAPPEFMQALKADRAGLMQAVKEKLLAQIAEQ